jgi:hypothetical protein
LQEEVAQLKRQLQERDNEFQQLYVEKRHCIATTGEEGQLQELEENPPHFSMWQKMKYVAVSIFSDLYVNMVYYFVINTLPTEWSFN